MECTGEVMPSVGVYSGPVSEAGVGAEWSLSAKRMVKDSGVVVWSFEIYA